MISDTRGLYFMKKDMFYVEFDKSGAVSLLMGYPDDSKVREKEKNAARLAISNYSEKASELIYSSYDHDEKYIVSSDDGIKVMLREELENKLLLASRQNDYYKELYENEMDKNLSEDHRVFSAEFWKRMAEIHPGMSIEQAIEYIKDHYKEFYVYGRVLVGE